MDTKNRHLLRRCAAHSLALALCWGGVTTAWADTPSDPICPLPPASATTGGGPAKCLPAKPIPKTTTVHAPQPAPSDVHQQTVVYCGAAAPVAAVSAVAAPNPPKSSSPEAACKKEPNGGVTKISVKLPKGPELNLESADKTIGILGLLLCVGLVGVVVWLGNKALQQSKGKGGWPLLVVVLVLLAVFGIGFLGYWWWAGSEPPPSRGRAALEAAQIEEKANALLASREFQVALQQATVKDLGEANDDRARLRSRASELEKELAVAQAKAESSGAAASRTSLLGELLYLVLGAALGLASVGFSALRSRTRVLELETVLASVRAALEQPPKQPDASEGRWERLAIGVAQRILDSVRSF